MSAAAASFQTLKDSFQNMMEAKKAINEATLNKIVRVEISTCFLA